MVHRAAAPVHLEIPVVALRAVVPVVDLLLLGHRVVAVDIDPDDFINMDVTKEGLALMYKSVCFHLDKWPGNTLDPEEQVRLQQLKDNLVRIILEEQFKNQR